MRAGSRSDDLRRTRNCTLVQVEGWRGAESAQARGAMRGRSPYLVAPPGALTYRLETPPALVHLHGFWTASAHETGSYAIPADACVDLVWAEGANEPLAVGPGGEATFVRLEASRTYWGVRFTPGGFTAATGCPAGDLAGLTVPAAEFFSTRPSGHPAEALRRMASPARRPVDAALRALLAAGLRASVGEQSDQHGWSERHLRRRVLAHAGVTPSRLLALRRVHVAADLALAGVPLATAAHRAGFADQSHFTRESRRVLGASPACYVRSVQAARKPGN